MIQHDVHTISIAINMHFIIYVVVNLLRQGPMIFVAESSIITLKLLSQHDHAQRF